MKRWTLIVAAVGLFAVPLSGVAAQSDEGGSASFDAEDTDRVTFYGHVFGHSLDQPMPANTEAPVGEDNYGLGTFDFCTPQGSYTLIASVRPGESCEDNPNHKLALFSTAGFVQVDNRADFQSNGAYSQLHNERGQTKDIHLDQGESITASMYATIDYHAWPVGAGDTNCLHAHPENVPCVWPYWGWDVGTQPNFVVEATLYQANLGERSNASAAPPVRDALESGDAEIVAQGQWGPDTASTGAPGTPAVQKFEIDLGTPETGTIDKDKDFFLVYDTFSDVNGDRVATHSVRWWGGELFPPTFEMPVQNAFQVERVVPSDVHEKLAILGIINTPWGSYDVDDSSIELTIEDSTGSTVDTDNINEFVSASVAHGGHFKPVNATWVWDYKADDVAPGDYTVTVSAQNHQGSSSASCEAAFSIEETDDGSLTATNVEPGECGIQTTTEEDLDDLQADPNDDGGS